MIFQSKKPFSYLQIFFITAFSVALTCLLFGSYYDSSDDAIINLLIQGKVGYTSYFPRFYLGFSQLLRFLFWNLPEVPWQAILFYTLLTIAFSELVHCLQLRFQLSRSRLIVGAFTIYFLIAIEHVMYFNMNRFSILISGIGVLTFFLAMDSGRKWQLIRGLILLVLGMAIRPNGGLMSVIIMVPGFIIYGLINGVNWKGIVKINSIILILFLAIYALLNFNTDQDANDYKYRNYLKSNIVDFGILKEEGLSDTDKMKIEAVHYGYISDDVITNDFLESITSNQRINLTGFKKNKRLNSVKVVFQKLCWDYSIFSLSITLLILYSWKQLRNHRKFVVVYNLFLITIPILVGYFLKIPDKILGPTLFLGLIVNLILMLQFCSKLKIKHHRLVQVFVACFIILFTVKFGHRVYASYTIQYRKARTMEFISKEFNEKRIITAKYNNVLLYSNPFWKYRYSECANLNISGWITLLPGYNKIYESFSKSVGWSDVFRNAIEYCDSKDVTFVFMFFEKTTAPFLEKYLKQFHELDVRFVPINKKNPEMPNQLFYYLITNESSSFDVNNQ